MADGLEAPKLENQEIDEAIYNLSGDTAALTGGTQEGRPSNRTER